MNGHWHLRKEIGIGHIISTMLLTIMLISGYVRIENRLNAFSMHLTSPSHVITDQRLDVVEAQVGRMQVLDDALTKRLDTTVQQTLQSQLEIIRRLERIEDRLNAHDERGP